MNDSAPGGTDPRRQISATNAGRAVGWRDALVAAALAIGLLLLARGLIKGKLLANLHSLLADGLWTNIGLLGAVVVVICVAAVAARPLARHIFFAAFAAALLIAFGWSGVLWSAIAFLAFSALGEAIIPGGPKASLFSLSLQAAIGAAIYVLVLGVMVHFRINTPLSYGALLLLPLLNRPALRSVTTACRSLFSARTLPTVGEIVCASILLFILTLHLTGAGLPERYADGALYHLHFAQTVARLGYWPADYRLHAFAVVPAGTDWLMGIGNMLAGEIGGQGFFLCCVSAAARQPFYGLRPTRRNRQWCDAAHRTVRFDAAGVH